MSGFPQFRRAGPLFSSTAVRLEPSEPRNPGTSEPRNPVELRNATEPRPPSQGFGEPRRSSKSGGGNPEPEPRNHQRKLFLVQPDVLEHIKCLCAGRLPIDRQVDAIDARRHSSTAAASSTTAATAPSEAATVST